MIKTKILLIKIEIRNKNTTNKDRNKIGIKIQLIKVEIR